MRATRWAILAACFVVAVASRGLCEPVPEVSRAAGTAVVVSPEGHLLTCAHVVEGAARISVRIGDRDYPAAVLAVEEECDLALLKVNATGLRAARLGGHKVPQSGTRVWAFGFPLSAVLGETVKVTSGTVSGIGISGTQQVIQTDAPVNPGNSGGPLVDDTGAVVGIVNAKLTGEEVSGVGFAIPITYARSFLRQEGVEFAGVATTSAPKQAGRGAKGAGTVRMEGTAVAETMALAVAFVTVDVAQPARPAGPVAVSTIASGTDWAIALSPDGKTLACAGGLSREASLWDVATGELVRTLSLADTEAYREALSSDPGKTTWLAAVTFSPDGTMLAGDFPPVGIVSWDVATGRVMGGIPTGVFGTSVYTFSPDERWLLYTTDPFSRCRDLEVVGLRAKEPRTLVNGPFGDAAISPDSTRVAVAYCPGFGGAYEESERPAGVEILDLATREVKQVLRPRTSGVRSVSFSPDGKYLAGVDGKSELRDGDFVEGVAVVSIWDLGSGAIVKSLSRPGLQPRATCFAPAGTVLAVHFSAPRDDKSSSPSAPPKGNVVVLWDTRTWQPILTLPGALHNWTAGDGIFSRDGSLLVTWDPERRAATVWRVPQG